MSATATPPRLLTAEEYGELPPTDHPTELVRGRVIDLPVPKPIHGYVCSKIDRLVGNFVEAHDLGRTFSNDAGVVTERDPDTVRGADVSYFSFARIPRGPLPETYPTVPPELVFEVLSPSDRWTRVFAKVTEYLTAGVSVVVVVEPDVRAVTVCRDAQRPQELGPDAELTLPDVLPGFAVPVARLFG